MVVSGRGPLFCGLLLFARHGTTCHPVEGKWQGGQAYREANQVRYGAEQDDRGANPTTILAWLASFAIAEVEEALEKHRNTTRRMLLESQNGSLLYYD